MDNATTGASDKRGLSNGPSFRRSPRPCEGPPLHHLSPHHLPPSVTTITISKDDATGYGMKISGDNPVYVQSVKAGGAAERAGLQSGDTIIKVNGINVTNLTHTEVVELIKAAAQVILTVQQFPLLDKSVGAMASPTLPSRHLSHTLQSQSRDRITAPQPVDHEKLRQLEHQKTHTLNLMLEKEQRYVDSLRSQLAKGNDSGLESKLQKTLIGAERRVQTLLQQLEQEGASPQIHTHQRTKSSPDTLQSNMSLAEATKRLIASESMSELTSPKRSKGGLAWEVETPRRATTPPGTPPPPYPTGQSPDDTYSHITDDDLPRSDTSALDTSDHSPMKGFSNFLIQSANQMQQPIISMEDEDMSDQEVNQMEDHGPFKSLSKLWNHQAHLAVFLNYVISNSDPSSLLFYLVTDLYKEGSAKEMKKWAYEIHSSFLVPGAPLRLNNVDENVAREIDDVLLKEFDKEEILRKIFWKARQKAKEELNEQLTDFQAKRTAGLGTLFGPKDSELEESIHDKNKETKIIESILVPKMEPYLEDIEKSVIDDRRFSTGAALGTVLGKVFGIKGQHFNSLLERCPTYVSKDKSLLKAKLIGKNRKMTRKGHICVAYQYYTVTYCNHCQLIIWGIGPQGYQCSNCGLNIHRHCVNVLEEYCPGPMVKKERGNDRISKLMEKIRPENTKRKPSSLNFAQVERAKRLQEEESADHDSGDRGGPKGPGDKRPDPVRESEEKGGRQTPHEAADDANHHLHDISQHVTKTKPNSASINRSESYKERIHQKRQLRERRKTSDPNLSKSNNDVEVDAQTLSFKSNSGSSSNSSLSTRSLESPSNSLEGVGASQQQQQNQLQQSQNQQQPWDSDFDDEADRSDWTTSVPEEVHKSLSSKERKRQEVINELFYTERSHVMGLKVLDRVFYKPMQEQHILSPDQLQLLFANLEEMIAFHSQLNSVMKEKRKENPIVGEVGQLLLDHFDGAGGESFKKAAAIFCAKQQIALEQLKEKRKKDPKLNTFLLDAEMNPRCRRLQLKDMLSKGWLRLTKYPLLFENIAKNTTSNDEEREKVNTAFERSKEILNHVDMAVKEAEDQNRLAEIQKRLDKSGFDKNENALAAEFKNLDLSRHKLVYEGSLTWRIANNRQKSIDLHVLLLDDIIILLQKQDEKYVLKFYNPSLSPIIKVSTVLVRLNAVDKTALFLVNTSHNGAQIYDLVASSISEKRKWFKHISDAADAYKQREGKNRRPELDTSDTANDKCEKEKEGDDSLEGACGGELLSPPKSSNGPENSPSGTPAPSTPPTPQPGSPALTTSKLDGVSSGNERKTDDIQIASYASFSSETTLIDPGEVIVSSRDVLTAEPVLTPLEKLKRKDELVRRTLYEKQAIVADILHVPREEFDNIVELAGEPAIDKEPSELVLAAVSQVHELTLVINEALKVTEEETVALTAESGTGTKLARLPGIPAYKVQGIASSLTTQLSQLLSIMVERDEERERLRRELQKSREQLHALHEKYDQNGPRNNENEKEETAEILTEPHSPHEVFVDALSGEAETALEATE